MSVVTARNRNAGQYYKNGKKKPPNWEYRFEGLPIDGHRNQISKAGFKTKAEAEIEGLRVYNEYMQSAEKKYTTPRYPYQTISMNGLRNTAR